MTGQAEPLREKLVAWSHLSSPQLAPHWCGKGGEEGHNGRWTPLKGCFVRGGTEGGDSARALGSRGIDLQVEMV